MSSVSALNSLLGSSSSSPSSSVDLSSLLQASSGASSAGIDVTSAVAAAVYAARASERIWQSQQAGLTSQTVALNQIETAATSLSSDMQSLNSLTGPLSARSVTSSNSNIVSGSAVSATAVGNHVVMVNALAKTASWYSDSVASGTAALPVGSFTISTATGSAKIDTGGGVNTLVDAANQINNTKGLGVTASVVSDSTGSRLAIVSNASGSAANFTVSPAFPVTASSWSSASLASSSTPLAAGSFTLGDGTTSATITVSATDTLSTLAAGINKLGLGVTASVVNDSTGTGSHLALASSGTSTALTISSDPAGFNMTQAVAGSDASLTIDGIPITSASNVVTGAVGGLTLNLQYAAQGAEVNLTIAPDTAQLSTAINQFVNDYNTAIGLVNSQFTFTGTGQGVLGSDPTVRSLQASLMQALSYSYTPESGTTSVSTLQSLGISMGNDGKLSVDSATLNSALQSSFSDVQNFFQGAALNGFANSLDQQIGNYTSPANGAFTVDLKSIGAENTDLQNHINDYETNYITQLQKQLTSEYSQAEILLQQLPTQLKQIQAELGNNNNSGN